MREPRVVPRDRIAIFDLDGTLLDSDKALVAAFAALGVPDERISFGLTLEEACTREGIAIDAYVAAYDTTAAMPFPGVHEMVAALPRWAVCSNKLGQYAREEIERLGWRPDVALFVEDFGGPKRLGPVLDELGVSAADVLFVGDSQHDRDCAREAGAAFALAGWNPRAASCDGDIVLSQPADVLELLTRSG